MPNRSLDAERRELLQRLADRRGKRVVFLAHCILNENTRYPGGACRVGSVAEIVNQCLDLGIGIVQLPCPEQFAWGGVLKRRFLRLYGAAHEHPLAWRCARRARYVAQWYFHAVYFRLARSIAAEIQDYVESDFEVVGVVGIDASPTCGVATTIDPQCAEALAQIPCKSLFVERENAVIQSFARPGEGMFIAALRKELERRRIHVPLLAHDLLLEIAGGTSNVRLGATAAE